METKLIINFELPNSKSKLRINVTNNITLKELCSKFFLKAKNIEELKKTNINLEYNDEFLDTKSEKSLDSLGFNNDSIIKVIIEDNNDNSDKEEMVKNSEERQKIMRNKSKHLSQISQEEANKSIEIILQDMAILGCETKEKILNNKIKKSNKFISTEDALKLKDKDDHFFALGILSKYLKQFKIITAIEKDSNEIDKKRLNRALTFLQFLVNGLILFKKYILKYKLNEKRIEELKNNKTEKQKFNTYFKDLIILKFNITKKDDIVITSYIENNNIVILLITKSTKLKFKKEEIKEKLKTEQDLNELTDFGEAPVLDAILLSKSMLDKRGDNKDGGYGQNEKRGGEYYYPPNGWTRIGVRVYGQYDKNKDDWLSWDNRKGEWCICYRGMSMESDESELSKYEHEADIKHHNMKVSKGTVCYQDPEEMEKKTGIISVGNEKYQLAFMLRVKPEQIRVPKSNPYFWVVNGTPDEIRPYGILIRKYSD